MTALGAVEGNFRFKQDDTGSAIITRYLGRGGAVVIPDRLGGMPVTSIESLASVGFNSVTSVTIPRTVTLIGQDVFRECPTLTSVTIPNSVKSIGARAFRQCTSLSSVAIPDSLTDIEDSLFWGCTSLTSVTIPNSVTSIEWGAFARCTSLTSVTIPNSVTSIGSGAFFRCTNLASIYFEGNLPSIVYAPDEAHDGLVDLSPFVSLFYRSGAAGWEPTFSGRSMVAWTPLPGFADWAAATGLTAQHPSASGEEDDPDGDGLLNRDERLAGTDPTKLASVLLVEPLPRPESHLPLPGGKHAVYFRSVPGRYYAFQSAVTAQGPWVLRGGGTGPATTTRTQFMVDIPTPPTHAFYRVLVLGFR